MRTDVVSRHTKTPREGGNSLGPHQLECGAVNKGDSSVSRAVTQGVLGMATCLLLSDVALAQSLKAAFQAQKDDRVRVQAICEAQYRNAQFHPLEDSKRYRYMVSDRGIQAINPQVVQQSSGAYIEVGASYWTVPAPDIVNSGREEQGSFSV
jgi:hypothetical protein